VRQIATLLSQVTSLLTLCPTSTIIWVRRAEILRPETGQRRGFAV